MSCEPCVSISDILSTLCIPYSGHSTYFHLQGHSVGKRPNWQGIVCNYSWNSQNRMEQVAVIGGQYLILLCDNRQTEQAASAGIYEHSVLYSILVLVLRSRNTRYDVVRVLDLRGRKCSSFSPN